MRPGPPHEVRIIGGLWKRSKLPVVDGSALSQTEGDGGAARAGKLPVAPPVAPPVALPEAQGGEPAVARAAAARSQMRASMACLASGTETRVARR